MKPRAVIIGIALFLGVAALVAGGWYIREWNWEERGLAATKDDLEMIGRAAEVFAREHINIEHWDAIRDAERFIAPLQPCLERGRTYQKDAWDRPYVLDRRDEIDRIVFTLRSDHSIEHGILGVEVAIERSTGKAIDRKELWK